MTLKTKTWLVHLFTATGALAGFLSLEAIFNNNIYLSFIWLSTAFFIDGIDGALARKIDVAKQTPNIDGTIVDSVVDYLNYTIIPSLMIYWFEMVPNGLELIIPGAIFLVDSYTFANVNIFFC